MGVVWAVRGFMVLQTALFIGAASMHFGLFLNGYGHRAAGTAESIIAAVLLLGLVLSYTSPSWARPAAITAQSLAVLGVIVGLFTIAVGVGPRTALDLTIHVAMLVLLVAGLIVTVKSRFGVAYSAEL